VNSPLHDGWIEWSGGECRKTPRQIAKDWRACPQHREAIEATITAEGMWPLFSKRDGVLYAKLDWAKITASGGGSYMGAEDRRFWAGMSPDLINASGPVSFIDDVAEMRRVA
jgi:hypothetical protein